jgi:ATP-dependent helicase/nuclease subunit B
MSRQATERGVRVKAWLAAGGIVLAATERARRSLAAAYTAEQREHGLLAWQTPSIFSWELWVREQWLARNRDGLMLLNTVQEQALWARAIRNSGAGAGLPQLDRLASTAMQAHRLLADHAPNSLRTSARSGWSDEAAIFSGWLTEFEAACQRDGLISACRVALNLSAVLLREDDAKNADESRPKLLLVGFDRLAETQKKLLNAWGEWSQDDLEQDGPEQDAPELNGRELQGPRPGTQSTGNFWAARDEAAELSACVQWLRNRRQADPKAQLLVVTTGLQRRRGELERALLRSSTTNRLDFEFSLGVPLAGIGIVRAALLLMRWLAQPLAESELDWLLTSGYAAADSAEELALAETMLAVRRSGAERPEWSLETFLGSLRKAETWSTRMTAVREQLRLAPLRQSPLEWATLTGQLLTEAAWPGFRPLGSVAFQAQKSFSKVIEACGSLGFDGSVMDWAAFVNALESAAATAIFAAESTDAAVLITEPLLSAGLLADGIWFLGADEQSWPGRGQPHPFLPAGLQRDSAMPHSSNQADWQLSRQATQRLLASADEVVFSFASHAVEAEARPSRLVVQSMGTPRGLPPMSARQVDSDTAQPATEWFEDASRPRFQNDSMAGGAGTLSRQSNCPFQAFATARLNTQDWNAAEAGLSARQRGQLLHGVLVRIWGGNALGDGPAPGAIWTHAELTAIPDLASFVRGFVDHTMHESCLPKTRNGLPDRFPPRLLALEADRLTRLVTEWLAYEQQRLPFSVDGAEVARAVTVAGLTVSLRLDRIDSVATGDKLVIDYKTGGDGPRVWEDDRPENVQLPLYATHAVPERVEGLVFARVKAGDVGFYGRVRNATSSLQPDLKGTAPLVKAPLTDTQLEDWRLKIEQLGEDFVAGHAEVDPKDGLKTCEHCYLHAVCRVYENLNVSDLLDSSEEAGSDTSEGGSNV